MKVPEILSSLGGVRSIKTRNSKISYAINNMAQGSVFRGHYSNQFDSNDPKLLALALSILQIADLREPIHLDGLALFCNLR